MQLTKKDLALAAAIAAAHPLDGKPAIARGNHLAAQNDEPEPDDEAERLAADVQLSQNKAERFHRRNDAQAMRLQLREQAALGRDL